GRFGLRLPTDPLRFLVGRLRHSRSANDGRFGLRPPTGRLRHSRSAMTLVDDVGLAPLPGDLERVEARLADAVRAEDRFLGEVAAHLPGAGGKRLRPMLTLCSTYAAKGAGGPATDGAITGACSVELVHLGSLYHDDVIDEAE